jgi:hypothetical protein
MGQLSDTAPEAERILIEIYRKMPSARKWQIQEDIFRTARTFHAAGVRRRNPSASERDIRASWAALTVGDAFPQAAEYLSMDQPADTLHSLRAVVVTLMKLDIPYVLGGSLAATLYGYPRLTHDADISIEPFAGKETQLAAEFGSDYYVSVPAMQQAVRQQSCFNIIHKPTSFKIDFFIRKDRPFDRSVMSRRRPDTLPGLPEQPIMVVSAEDLILLKLEWYRLGDEVSDQQWKDIRGVLQVQAGRLDEAYLDYWAADLHLSDLLARARQEIKQTPLNP